MNVTRNVLLAVSCSVILAIPLSAEAAGCVPDPSRGPIRVSVGADRQPVVAPDEVSACEGETLRWVFQGSDAKEFAVIFRSDAGSPFDWDRQTGATMTGKVKSGAAKDGNRTEYKYDVEVDGKVLDPRIIVQP